MVRDRDELAADLGVLAHRVGALLEGEEVPRPLLHERVDDEVRRLARDHLALADALLVGVDRRLRRREVRVRRRQPAGERRAVEGGAELEQVVVALGDLPEEEVGLGADPRDVVGPQALHPAGPLLDDVGERLLAGLALLDGQAPPGGIDLEEAVGDVLPDLDALDALVRRLCLAHARIVVREASGCGLLTRLRRARVDRVGQRQREHDRSRDRACVPSATRRAARRRARTPSRACARVAGRGTR